MPQTQDSRRRRPDQQNFAAHSQLSNQLQHMCTPITKAELVKLRHLLLRGNKDENIVQSVT